MEHSAEGPSIHDIRIINFVFPGLACAVTLFRVAIRTRAGIWWWDDTFAFLSMLCMGTLMGLDFLHLKDPTTMSRTAKIGVYYSLAEVWNSVVWLARLSILFSIIRIAPTQRERNRLYWLVALFLLIWVVLSAQTIWVCEPQSGWKDALFVQCELGKQVAITQLITDTVADSTLIVIPLRLLWNIQLKRSLRNRLIALFSTSIITTIVSLVHAVIVFKAGGLQEAMAAIFEDAISLIVCNLTVVVTTLERLLSRGGEQEYSDSYKLSSLHFGREAGPATAAGSVAVYGTSFTADNSDFQTRGVIEDQATTGSYFGSYPDKKGPILSSDKTREHDPSIIHLPRQGVGPG